MKTNHLYVTYKQIKANLGLVLQKKNIQELQIMSWSAECERDYIQDIITMYKFLNVGLVTESYSSNYDIVSLPCNIYKILNIYSDPSNPISQIKWKYINKENTLKILVEKGHQAVYLDFIGIAVDEEGIPLIARSHVPAVETFCTMKIYYEDFLEGISQSYLYLEQKFSGQMIAIRQTMRHVDPMMLNDLNVINGDMLESIGNMRIINKMVQ